MANKSGTPAKKPRLGRGLSSLLSSTTSAAKPVAENSPHANTGITLPGSVESDPKPNLGMMDISLDQIAPNPHQPRRNFDPDELVELARTISQQGIVQPLVVASADGHDVTQPYVLVAGERRLRAAKQAGLDTVPCVVRKVTRRQMLEWAIIENLQRVDLNPIERAEAFREYIDRFKLTQAEAGEKLGQNRSAIANHLRILDLQKEVQNFIAEGKISFGHGKILAGLADKPKKQLSLARKIINDGLSVRQLEAIFAQDAGMAYPDGGEQAEKKENEKPPYIRDIETRIASHLGLRVKISPTKKKDTGKIVIDYASLDDFDRFLGSLGMAEE